MNEFEAHEGSYDHLHKKVGDVLFLVCGILGGVRNELIWRVTWQRRTAKE